MEQDDCSFVFDENELMADRTSRYRFRQAGPGPGDGRPGRKAASKLWLLKRKLTTKQGWAVVGRKLRRKFRP